MTATREMEPMASDSERVARGRSSYGTRTFLDGVSRTLDMHGLHVRSSVELLLDAGIIPHADVDPLLAKSKDATTILTSLATRADHACKIEKMREVLTMRLHEIDPGNAQPSRRDGRLHPERPTFGCQLNRTITRCLHGGTLIDADRVVASIGGSVSPGHYVGRIAIPGPAGASLIFWTEGRSVGGPADAVPVEIESQLIYETAISAANLHAFVALVHGSDLIEDPVPEFHPWPAIR